MRCKKCGTELPNNAQFCGRCGAAVERGSGKTPQKKKKRWIWIAVAAGISLGIAAVAIGIEIALVLGRSNDKASEQPAASVQENTIAEEEEGKKTLDGAEAPTSSKDAAKDNQMSRTSEQTAQQSFAGEWTIDVEKTNRLNDASLQDAYGTGIQYGYHLTLGEDGSFSWGIGLGNGGEGTWRMENETIYADETEYESGTQETIELKILSENEQTWLVQDHYGYTLYWVKEKSTAEQREATADSMESDNEYAAMYMDFIENGGYLQDVYSGHDGIFNPDGGIDTTDNYEVDFDNAKTGWSVINITDKPELIIYADVGEAADPRMFFWVYRCWHPESSDVVTPYCVGGGAGKGDKLYYTNNLEDEQQTSAGLVDGIYYEGDYHLSGATTAYQCCSYNDFIDYYCFTYTIGDVNTAEDPEVPCSLAYIGNMLSISQQDFDYCISSLKEIVFNQFPNSNTDATGDKTGESQASDTPDLTAYYWYQNIQCAMIFTFQSDGTYTAWYTEPWLSPSEEDIPAENALMEDENDGGIYSFDGKTLTLTRNDGYTISMDLYNAKTDAPVSDAAAQCIRDYDGSLYFYETDWLMDPDAMSDNAFYLVRLGAR